MQAARELFDVDFYRRTYSAHVADAADLFDEYVHTGWRHGRDPSARFSTRFYLDQNSDVRASGLCPLLHYVEHGAAEGRLPRPRPEAVPARARETDYFDAAFYVAHYPDVTAANIDPLTHYMAEGWREGRNPSATFDTAYYLKSNPDILASGEHPLTHYARIGHKQGRRTSPPPNIRRTVINNATPPRTQAVHWRRQITETLLKADDLGALLAAERAAEPAGLALSLSHDDYATITGGVQNCVGDEEVALVRANWTYVHIHPAQPLPMLADPTPAAEFLVRVRINGKAAGVTSFDALIEALDGQKVKHGAITIIAHHLLGFCPELVAEAAERLEAEEVLVWQHDYFTLCPNPPLLRNNVQFCNGPPVDSASCGVCVYGEERKAHLPRMVALFEQVRPTVISPSETASSFWRERQTHPHSRTMVIPHGTLSLTPARPRQDRGVIRVAHLGAPTYHKGWYVFEDLAAIFAGDARYRFFHLGSPRPPSDRNITHVDVSITESGRKAMTEAVYEHQIDVAVNWSLCFETFSFTAHEALAGGAFVVARRGAGHVWPAICDVDPRRGCAVEDEEALLRLFKTGEVLRLAGQRRPGVFTVSGATAEYLLGRPDDASGDLDPSNSNDDQGAIRPPVGIG